MSLNGFITIYRNEMETSWYKNKNTKDVLIHICMKANFTETSFDGKKILPGQHIFSHEKLGEEIGLSRQEVRTALKKLEEWGEITTKTTNKYTIATVVNWGRFQANGYFATNKATINQPTDNQQATINQPRRNNDNKGIREEGKKDSQSSLSLSGPVPYPQSVAEVREYCIQMVYTKVDPAAFFNYYEERNWMTGGKPVENWHALVKHWNETQRESTEPVQEQTKQAEAETKENDLSYELWEAYNDLSEDGEIEYNPILSTSLEEMLKCYEDYSGYGPLVTEFYNYFNSKGWKVCGWKIRDWKLAFLIWLRFKNGGLEAKQIEQRMDNEKFSSIDSMFFCTEEERNKIKEKIDWRAIAAR